MKNAEVTTFKNEAVNFTVPDSSETDLYKTVEYAADIKNDVQCTYTDSERNSYAMTNADIRLVHKLKDIVKTASLYSADGTAYAEDTFRTYYVDELGVKHYFENSKNDARVNTIRLGLYYYDCNVRDLDLGRFKVNKEFHVYSDKIYAEYDLLANSAGKLPKNFGSEIELKKDNVISLAVKDKNGVHTSIGDFDAASVEYAAFDTGAGVFAVIVPADGSCASLSVCEKNGKIIITQTASLDGYDGINKYDETGGYENYKISFGCRLFTAPGHDLKAAEKAAYEERNPLEFTVEDDGSGFEAAGYDALRGTYTVKMKGTSFQYAYDRPDLRFTAKIKFIGGTDDRKIMLRTTCSDTGCLECAALVDKNSLLMPVDIEVCKNFRGDGGDSGYSFNDYAYSDTFTPIYVEGESEKQFSLVNLYQNWGKYPLKQLSSIEFHVSYYHLSTGTTESNCIAPYFVFDRDGWTLPDFRNASGTIWATQPQFNSVGILKFMSYRDKSVKQPVMAEFSGSTVNSYGPTYADVTNRYVSDCGSYTYSLRHIEFPQNDENRTYYTVDVDFNDTVSFENFKRDFDLFYFDGRFVAFDKMGYLDENNNPVNAPVSKDTTYHILGSEAPYFGFYKINDKTAHYIDECFGCNFALLVKDSEITVNGQKQQYDFVFRESGNEETTTGCLSLDTEAVTFNKGDSIRLELVLLPWGRGDETDDATVLKVREDSCLKPLTVAGDDNGGYIPQIKADNNSAVFTLKGGRGNNTVVVNSFTSMKKPAVYKLVNGEWQNYELSSVHGYDGYMIRTNSDNTYSISFVFNSLNPDEEYTFKIEN